MVMQIAALIRVPVRSRGMQFSCLFVAAITCVGCRQRLTSVAGTVTLDGKPLAIQAPAEGKVTFRRTDGHGAIATGELDSEGHFELATGSSFDVAPGDYDVAVTVAESLPSDGSSEPSGRLMIPVKYGSAIESGLHAHVEPGENRVTFALESWSDEQAKKPVEHQPN
jgi:hypothetical protein